MLRNYLLGPVICFMILGFIMVDYGQKAQARTTDCSVITVSAHKDVSQDQKVQKKQAKHSIKKSKKSKSSHLAKKTTKKKQAESSVASRKKHHKKIRYAKHRGKAIRHQHVMACREDSTIDTSSTDLTPKEPIDLWLAKDTGSRLASDDGELDPLTMKIIESAYSYIGTPYRYGGTTPNGFDCSGFVRHVFQENGISLSRSSRDQALEGKLVPLSDLKPGDLIFFNMHHRKHCSIDHVGLYVGKGQFIHAASRHSREIRLEDLENKYLPKIVETRRVLDYTR